MDSRDEFQDVNELTQRVIGCAMRVSNTLGMGFLEKVYENALVVEMRLQGIECKQQHSLQVMYEGVVVGEFICDIIVENRVWNSKRVALSKRLIKPNFSTT